MANRQRPVHEIDADISGFRQQLTALTRYHPPRPLLSFSLGFRLLERYKLSNQMNDIDEAILHLTKSLLFSPISWLAHDPMIIEALNSLALSLFMRSRVSEKPENSDAICAANYLRYLRDPAHTPFAFRRRRQTVTALLVSTLTSQIKLKASDGLQTLEEMKALTQELLTSDPSSHHTTWATTCFTSAVEHKLPELSLEPLNKIIEFLRLARVHKPELRDVHFFLAKCLCARYPYTVDDEIDEAVSILDEMITSSSPGDKYLAECQELIPELTMIQTDHPENSEEAIYRARAFLASSSVEDPLYPTWSKVLERATKNRFKNFGPIDGLEASSSSDPLADIAQKTRPLGGLLHGIRNNSITDIDEAIKLGRSVLASSAPSDFQSSCEFGEILFEAFERTKNIDYLDESIHTLRQVLACRPSKLPRIQTTAILWNSLYIRSQVSQSHRMQDRREIVELLSLLLDDGRQFLSLTGRFQVACLWAIFARVTRHPSAFTAYETALSLMQDISLFSPTLQLQHATLTMLHPDSHVMPLGYASYQVERGQLKQAIETLERGRALLWSQMRHFRTSIDELLDADSELGHKFAALNRDLEELTKSIAPSHQLSMDDVVAHDVRAGDKFGIFLRRQRELLKERNKLISQIRALPGFDRFLTSPLFDTLRYAASSGPVIIVNHYKLRSDILILLHNASPSLIPIPGNFYHRASALKDILLTARDIYGLDSSQYDEALAFVLKKLYELVGKSVIDRLHHLQVPDQSRIWWCPTSVFCSLPLHAMGPIPSGDGELRYFLDLYISSYTPSLSALIQSRVGDPGSRSSGRPSVLLVAQTDSSLPTVEGEIEVIRALDTEVTSFISEAATRAAVLDGFHRHQFVHFACHGTLEAGKPFEAGFKLHRGERLTLLEIVRSHLPTAEFAFLSACHTAEVTEGSIIDEGLHLAAAVQYCGFRSVVGTMWAMMDEDGPQLAENFYKALFSNSRRDQGIPYHERSAKALRFAVKKLRRKRQISLERWVNFVHYGA